MSRHTGPKNKLSRRENFDIYNKGEKLKKLGVKPGQSGNKRPGKISEYGKQLRSKQLAKRYYGVIERQFRNYVIKANRSKSKSGEMLVNLLEKRLDNVVFRLGFTKTRPAARQLISHGHVLVNNKILKVPSYEVKLNDEITIDEVGLKIPSVVDMIENQKPTVPDWLNRTNLGGKMTREPLLTDLKEPINIIDIIEFYSR